MAQVFLKKVGSIISCLEKPNFSDSVGSAAKIQTLTPNATKCPISFPNVASRTAFCLKHSIVSKTSIENQL